MLVSLNWLKQYLPELHEESPEVIAARLSESLAEVENINRIGEGLEGIYVGEIKKVEKHPKKEHLTICTVNDGGKIRKIICGAPNVSEGIKVAVCRPGGTVYNPAEKLGSQTLYKIEEKELAGVKSQGMICSMKELGLADSHEGIWILPDHSVVGLSLTELMKDIIFEIENKSLTHRPDCFSHEGIARELSAILKTPFKKIDAKTPLIPTQKVDLKAEVRNKELCSRFSVIVMTNVKVQASPLWLQLRLLSIGIRPINNIVDVTNYFMIDMGQPMHAFDYEKIEKGKLIVRNAEEGEKLKTLDEVERKLSKEMVVVADPVRVLSVAGIIGGESSEIKDSTRTIVLEAANWEMFNNRRTARVLGVRTEANTRFEKGQDPNNTQEALERAIHLVSDIAGGEIASEFVDIYEKPVTEKKLVFDLNAVKKILGTDVTKDQIVEILRYLEIGVSGAEKLPTKLLGHSEGNKVELVIPSFRKDLNITEDIVEEIGRIYGYNKVTPTLPSRTIAAAEKNDLREFLIKTKLLLASLGLDEIYTYSFVGEDEYKKAGLDVKDLIKLENPLAPELGLVRNSIIPSHLSKLELNLKNFDEVMMFEINRVNLKDKKIAGLPEQPFKLAGIIAMKDKEANIYTHAKGIIDELFEKLNIEKAKFKNIKDTSVKAPTFHPVRTAQVFLGDDELGLIGEVHPSVLLNYGIDAKVAIFEFDIEILKKNSPKARKYIAIPSLQKIERDLSVWVNSDLEVQRILEAIEEIKERSISEIRTGSIFIDPKKPEEKSVTFKIIIQPTDRSLLDDEANKIVVNIFKVLEKKFGAKTKR